MWPYFAEQMGNENNLESQRTKIHLENERRVQHFLFLHTAIMMFAE